MVFMLVPAGSGAEPQPPTTLVMFHLIICIDNCVEIDFFAGFSGVWGGAPAANDFDDVSLNNLY